MAILQLARHAMATRFELVLVGDNPVALRAAGEEALDEIERLEAQLSLFRPTSEIAHLNARAALEPVRVTPAVFRLLEHAHQLTQQTGGAFDVTIAPLMRCWGFMGGSGHLAHDEELARARTIVGMHLVRLDRDSMTVRFEREGMMIDLGAIGKGYAVDRAIEILKDAGVDNALVHGGTSTIYGLGHPPESDAWKIAITSPNALSTSSAEHPFTGPVTSSQDGSPGENLAGDKPVDQSIPFATVRLCDASLSVSAIWGKSFRAGGKSFGHIFDPRSGEPADRAVLSAVVLPSATETDALSTALLTLGPAGHEAISNLRPGMKTLVVAETAEGLEVKSRGIEAKKPG